MRKKLFFVLFAVLLSYASFAIDPISGSPNVCVGATTMLTNTTPGGSWSSSNPTRATVGPFSGLVSGLSAGSLTITYTVGVSYVTLHFTVSAPPPAISGGSTVCLGHTMILSNATPGGTWSSANPAIATVSSTGMVTGIAGGVTNISYSVGPCSVYKTITVNAIAAISGSSTACIGSTLILTPSNPGGSWTSGNPSLATVSSSGVVSALAPGVVNIYYTLGGCYSFQSVTVNPTPVAISGSSSVCAGASITLTNATPGGTWSSSHPGIATVNSGGVVAAITAGVVTISYSFGGCIATKIVTVHPAPGAISGGSSLCLGAPLTLTNSTPGGTWSSSNHAIATVSSGGVVSGVMAGVVNITYSVGGCFAYTTITVSNAPAPIMGSSSVCAGASITLTNAVPGGTWTSSHTGIATVNHAGVVSALTPGVVTITYTIGSCSVHKTVTVHPAPHPISGGGGGCIGTTITLSTLSTGGTWSSSNTAVATVNPGGIVTLVSAGTCTIYYTIGSCHSSTTITVHAAPAVITGSSTVCLGATTALTASIPGGIWSSTNPAVATVSSTGVVTGIAAGVVNISYVTGSGCAAFKTITVNAVSAISGSTTLCVGSSITLTPSSPGGSWTSGGPSLATVSSAGVVTGLAPGVVNIYYTIGGCYSFISVTVNTAAAITGSSSVCAGDMITLSATPAGGTWSSGATWIATVSPSGVVTGVSHGVVHISYSVSGCGSVYKTVTVYPTPAPIAGSSTVCLGSGITLTDPTPGGTWTSSDISIATVSPAGLVSGLAGGVVTITYTVGGCSAYKTVTVNSAATITGSSTVCVGSTITLLAGTPGGSWTSGGPSVATVSSTGVVTGHMPGVVNIYYTISGCYTFQSVTVNATTSITGSGTVCTGTPTALTGTPSGGTWSSGATWIATVSTGGIVTGHAPGTANIHYSVAGCGSAYTTVTVDISPAPISGSSTVCLGHTSTLTNAVPGGTWSSSNIAVATVSSAGVVSGISGGVANITYAIGACFTYTTVTVNAVAAISGTNTLCIGSSATLTAATPGGSWTSGNPSLASVTSGGIITGLSTGVVNIYYTIGGCYTFQSVTVNPAPSHISGSSSVCIGYPVTLTHPTPGGTWSSSNTFRAIVSPAGVVTGLTTGIVNITYTLSSGCYVYTTMTVNGSPVAISGSSAVCTGETITLTNASPGGTWTSSNTAVATVSAGGIVTGITPGVVTIYYTVGPCYAAKMVTVNPTPAPISGGSYVCIGTLITLTDATPGGTWSSSNTFRATVSTSGVVTGLTAGVVNITYTLGSCYVYKTVTVYAAPLPIVGSSSVCVGSTRTLSNPTSGGIWSSSSIAIATVSPAGVVTGVTPGVVTIYYTIGLCFASKMVTVYAMPAPITGSSVVFAGFTTTLSNTVPGGTWSSSNTGRATVNPSTGLVSGHSSGLVNISYTIGTCAVFKTMFVIPWTFGPEVISGSVFATSGAGKGTGAGDPVTGMNINLLDAATNDLVAIAVTDVDGGYFFSDLPVGNYIVSPEEEGYTTISSPVINVNSATASIKGVNFIKHTGSLTVTPKSTAVNELSDNSVLSIYPNPAGSTLSIKWQNQEYGNAGVVITDVTGRIVYNSNININSATGQTQIELPELKNGIYLITIRSETINYSSKLMIQK